MDSMATEVEDRCPVCLDSWDDPAYVMPCLHQFCYRCILQWAQSKPECPLCKRRVRTIVHSVRADDDFEEVVVRPALQPSASAGTGQAGGAPRQPATHSPPRPATPQPLAAESDSRAPVGGLQLDTWVSLFGDNPVLLQRLLPWLQEQLQLVSVEEPSMVAVTENLILTVLVYCGLDEEGLVQLLEISVRDRAVTFLRQVVNVLVQLCSRATRRLVGLGDSHAANEQENTPAAAPSPAASQRESPVPGPAPSSTTAGDEDDEDPSSSTAGLRGVTNSPSNAPVPTHGELRDEELRNEELHGDVQQAVAGASTASQGSTRSSGRPRRAPKRRAAGTQDSAQPPKRPPRRRN